MWLAFNRMWRYGFSSLVVALFLATTAAQAATLNVVGGILQGASGVDVGGDLYNVEFVDGTCIALFSGCDSASDFTFTTAAAATLASQALLDQVFIDGVAGNFDTLPALTQGCTNITVCGAYTPFGPNSPNFYYRGSNNSNLGTDGVFGGNIINRATDLTGSSSQVFAVWSTVPEPNTALLLAMGLAGLGWRGRVRQS